MIRGSFVCVEGALFAHHSLVSLRRGAPFAPPPTALGPALQNRQAGHPRELRTKVENDLRSLAGMDI